jgi:hypothetical protein
MDLWNKGGVFLLKADWKNRQSKWGLTNQPTIEIETVSYIIRHKKFPTLKSGR